MNFLKIIDGLDTENLEKEEKERFLSRKEALGKLTNFSKKLAISVIPLGAIGAFVNSARAQSNGNIVDVLNFALTLEYLEAEYYQQGLDSGVIESDTETVFQQISDHEQAHVTFLQDTIESLDESPAEKPLFDFTAGGQFDPFNNYEQFLALSQAFEDTGVRAYKGQAGNLQGSPSVLTAALQIHSVEARHASQVRRIRGLKGWITQDNRGEGMPEATQPVYNGEGETSQLGIDVTSNTQVSADAVTEGWDEPLTKSDAQDIAGLFIESE